MTRTMYDSLNPEAIPQGSELVASYIDGENAPAPGWEERFAGRTVVRIARIPTTDDGHVLDAGDNGVTAEEAIAWVALRRSAGHDPSVYINAARWSGLRGAFVGAGVAEPHWWVARWDNVGQPLDGAVAKQYADSKLSGGDYDVSIVADVWPGVDTAGEPGTVAVEGEPTYIVEPGDSLWLIAQRHRMTLPELEQLNPGAGHPAGDFSVIWPGDVLRVTAALPLPELPPPAAPYIVQHGDTLTAIAALHHVTLAELEAANPHAGHPAGDFSMIWPGDAITIP